MDFEPAASHHDGPDSQHTPGSRPSIAVSADGQGLRLEVRGELDGATADLLVALLHSAEQADAEVVSVDVGEVTGFTEHGVGVLARSLALRQGGPKVRYRAGTPGARRLLLAAAGARACPP